MSGSEILSSTLHSERVPPGVTRDLHGGPRRPPRWRRRRGAPRPGTLLAAAGTAILAAVLAWGWVAGSDARALRALPAAERTVLLQRSEANLRDLCLHRPDRPRAFCRGQAELLASLQECRGACLDAAREELRADSAVK